MVRVFYAYRHRDGRRLVPSVEYGRVGESRAAVVARLTGNDVDRRLVCEPFADRESVAACRDMTRDALKRVPARDVDVRTALINTSSRSKRSWQNGTPPSRRRKSFYPTRDRLAFSTAHP